MHLTLRINCDTHSFKDGNLHCEIARIMRSAARNIELGMDGGKCKDYHGNEVGRFKIEEEEVENV